jgi:hypothetical protein
MMTADHVAAEERLADNHRRQLEERRARHADVNSFSVVRDTYAAALAPSKGRLIRCTVAGLTTISPGKGT